MDRARSCFLFLAPPPPPPLFPPFFFLFSHGMCPTTLRNKNANARIQLEPMPSQSVSQSMHLGDRPTPSRLHAFLRQSSPAPSHIPGYRQ